MNAIKGHFKSIGLLLSTVSIFLINSGFKTGDDPIIKKLIDYKMLLEQNNIEKIHIHTNQPFYAPHDTVWFKAIVINTYYDRPSVLSKSLTVELINEKGKVVIQTHLLVNSGLTSGRFALTDSIQTGIYRLRAYTSQMKKYGENFFYEKSLIIKNKTEASKPVLLSGMGNSIQFFPEGGELVEGISSVVAFKSIGSDGMGINSTGSIMDEMGNSIARFAALHLGMGTFVLNPKPGRTYYASVSFNDGSQKKIPLPVAKPEGYTMKITHATNSITLQAFCSSGLQNKGQLTLVVAQDGITRYVSKFHMASAEHYIDLPDSLFNTGIAQFTLIDPEHRPVSERLIFIDKKDMLRIVSSVKKTFTKREPVKLLVDLKNQEGHSEIGSLSVSVYNETEIPFPDDNEGNIFTDLLLTADLKGFVERPGYYFSHPEDVNRMKHLDILLLTQGWRKFSWKDNLAHSLPAITDSVSENIELAGRVRLTSGRPYANGEVSLFQPGSLQNLYQTHTDHNGNFNFKNLHFMDTVRFLVSTGKLKDKKNQHIEVFPPRDIHRGPAAITPLYPDSILIKKESKVPENKRLDELKSNNNSRSQLLKVVEVTAKRMTKIESTGNLNGSGNADVIVTAEDLETTHDLVYYLTSRVNGLKFYEGRVYSRDVPQKNTAGGYVGPIPAPMLIVRDGMYLSQGNFSVSDIDPNEVASIEVLKGAATTGLYGIEGSGGVLVITTKKGRNYTAEELGRTTTGLLPVTLVGYQSPREFYSPTHHVSGKTANLIDFRKALYWNPNVVVGLTDQTEINYFNSDYSGTYKIVIEGINAEGRIARSVYRYTIE